MIGQALSLCADAFSAIMTWWNQITDAIPGSRQLIIGAFVMFGAVRFLVSPIFGTGMGSDFVFKPKSDSHYRDGTQARLPAHKAQKSGKSRRKR